LTTASHGAVSGYGKRYAKRKRVAAEAQSIPSSQREGGRPKVQLREAERREQKQIPSRNADRDANAARRPGIALRAPGLARDDSKDGPKRRRDHEPALRKQSKLRGQN
jgi:hypothetical protein